MYMYMYVNNVNGSNVNRSDFSNVHVLAIQNAETNSLQQLQF